MKIFKKENIIFVSTLTLIVFVFVFLPHMSFAQEFEGVPCTGVVIDGKGKECDFNALMELVSNIINYLVLLAVPLAVISFAVAGFKIMLARDNVGKRKEAIGQMWKVAQGFAVLLAAWLIVKTVLGALLNKSILGDLPIQL